MTADTVEVIEAADRERAVASLTLAFSADPVIRWAWPDQQRYLAHWPRFTEAFGGAAFDHGTAHGLENCMGVALWLAPGIEPDAEKVMAVMQESLDEQTFADIGGVFEQMEEHHPTDEHWYLPLTGVDPVAQGRGLGAALLRHALATCDSDGLPAYLEATSPRSRTLYLRHGFNVTQIIQAGTSPPLWAMLRPPTA